MLSQENITMVIQNLATFVKDSVNTPVDHTRENLNETAIILTIIASHVQNQTTDVDSMVNRNSTQFTAKAIKRVILTLLRLPELHSYTNMHGSDHS